MLLFRDQHWLTDPAETHFSALIRAGAEGHRDVFWQMRATFSAGGAKWRRVLPWERPRVDVTVSDFIPEGGRWVGIRRISKWAAVGECAGAGATGRCADVNFWENPEVSAAETSHGRVFWRVVKRERARFLVELACMAGERIPRNARRVLSDGTEELAEEGPEFWMRESRLYMIEEIPFGTADVCVPATVDPEGVAVERAAALLGAPEPEHVEILDGTGERRPDAAGGIWVKLHFHGRYGS